MPHAEGYSSTKLANSREQETIFRKQIVDVFSCDTVEEDTERGVRTRVDGRTYTLSLIKNLVGQDYSCGDEKLLDGHFFLCDICTRRCDNNSRDFVLWSIDLGDISTLPILSHVEKAAIARSRIYGTVLKIKEKVACNEQPLLLKGHFICFPHDAAEKVAAVLPRTDLHDTIQIHFVGSKSGWEQLQPLLKSSGGVLEIRIKVIEIWLGFLKARNRFYHDIVIDTNEDKVKCLEEARDIVCRDAAITTNPLIDDNIGLDAALGNDKGPTTEMCGVPSVVLQSCGPTKNIVEAAKDIRRVLAKETGGPLNEFEQNEELLATAFPWVFALGDLPSKGKLTAEIRRALLLRYDHRVEREPTLVFLLFNQMQRHSFACNIAHADSAVAEKLNELIRRPDFEQRLREIAEEKPSPEAKQLFNYLQQSIKLGQGVTAFSEGECKAFYAKMIAEVRFRGAPSVWLTLSPSAMENSFCLRLCYGAAYSGKEEYSARSAKVLESPAMTALFFEILSDAIEECILAIPDAARRKSINPFDKQNKPGAFGRCSAYCRGVECQTRTLLHFHALMWTDISPEVIQQAIKLDDPLLSQILSHFEDCMKTNMPSDFWEKSNLAWEKCERFESPSLQRHLRPDSAEDLLAAVSSVQLHRRHKPVCWEMQKGSSSTTRCRFGFPQGLWTQPTCPVQLSLLKKKHQKSAVNATTEISRNEMNCTHAWKCSCESAEDLTGMPSGKPIIIESTRPTNDDRLVANFTEEILRATCSNSQTTLMSTISQTSSILPYLIKYSTKHKTSLAQCVTSIIAARQKMSDATTLTSRTFWNKLVNAVNGQNEVPATMACFSLMGHKAFKACDEFWYVFVWDAVSPSVLQELQFSRGKMEEMKQQEQKVEGAENAEEAEEAEEGEENEEAEETQKEEESEYVDFGDLQEERAGDSPPAGMLLKIGERYISVAQWEIYEHRPTELEDMCFVTFCVCTELEKIQDGTAGREDNTKGNPRYRLLETSRLYAYYVVQMRNLYKVPVLGGNPPPSCPPSSKADTVSGILGRKRWALFWNTALIPWRDRDSVSCSNEEFCDWLLESLHSGSGTSPRAKALFCLNATFAFRKNDSAAICLDKWRFRSADTKQEDAIKKAAKETTEDCVLAEEIGSIAAELVRLMSLDTDGQRAFQRQAQLDVILTDRTACNHETMVICNNSDELQSCSKDVEEYEDHGESGDSNEITRSAGIPACLPETLQLGSNLNTQQKHLINEVYHTMKLGRQRLLFVQGEAGTGKTFCIKELHAQLAKYFGANWLRCFAPTGVSAGNLLPGTLTIHKGLAINPKVKKVDQLSAQKQPLLQARYTGTRCFVIDEISMVSPALLLQISQRLKELAKLFGYSNNDDDFGGYTIIAMGDFRQIPPVRSKSLLEEGMYPTKDPASSEALGGAVWRKFEHLMFIEQMRAREQLQQRRIDILRQGKISEELLNSVQFLSETDMTSKEWEDATFLVGTNEERHALNETLGMHFARTHGVPFVKWHNVITGSIVNAAPQGLLDSILDFVPELTGSFVQGAPAMILNNFSPACGLANGSTGRMVGLGGVKIDDEEKMKSAEPGSVVWLSSPPTHILVHVKAMDCSSVPRIRVSGKEAIPIKLCPDDNELPKVFSQAKSRTVSFMWHYVALGFCYTFHKCQGKTLDKVIVCLDTPRITFEQVLVALTRVRNGGDLRILKPLCFSTEECWKKLSSLKPNSSFDKWFDPGHFPSHVVEGLRQFDTLGEDGRKRKRECLATNTTCVEGETFKVPSAQKKKNMRKFGTYIDASEIDKVIRIASETLSAANFAPLKFKSGDALQLLESDGDPWEARYGEKYVTYLWYSSHFVAVLIDCHSFTVTIANSLREYCEGEMMRKLELLVKWLNRSIGGASFSICEKKCRQQKNRSNDCGIISAENCINWLFPGANVELNRKKFATIFESETW